MRIEPSPPPPATIARAARRTRSRAGDFALPDDAQEEDAAASALPGAPGLTAASCLLALR